MTASAPASSKPRRRRWQYWLAAALLVYAGSYFVWSRVSSPKLREMGLDNACYFAPVSPETLLESPGWQLVDRSVYYFYSPIWYVDYHVFGGPYFANLHASSVGHVMDRRDLPSAPEALSKLAGRSLTHGSHEVLMTGWSDAKVRALLGEPWRALDADFKKPKYGQPANPPDADRQWVYLWQMEWVLIYFKDGKVVLAIREWSDF